MNKNFIQTLLGLLMSLILVSGTFSFTNDSKFALVPNEKGEFPSKMSRIVDAIKPFKYAEAVYGVCGNYPASCTSGTQVVTVSNSSYVAWECRGDSSTAYCSMRAGSCAPAKNACSIGSAINISENASNYLWDCQGYYNGYNVFGAAACTFAKSVPLVNGACDTVTLGACTAGSPTSVQEYTLRSDWTCVGTGGGTTASCSSGKAACDNTTYHGCLHSTLSPSDQTSDSTTNYWYCDTNYAARRSGQCSMAKTYASCGTSINSCAVGTVSTLSNSGGNYYWYCYGTPYISSGTCTSLVGVCDNSSWYSCSTGSPVSQTMDGTNAYWYCAGTNGAGNSAQCSKALINGVCGTTAETCAAGNYNNNPADDANYQYWNCTPIGPGSSSGTCSAKKGKCGSSYNGCAVGSATSLSSDGSYSYWYCAGENGAANSTQCSIAKTNGECGGPAYSCNAGTSVNNSNNGTVYTWNCNGINGGTNTSQCSTYMPVNASCGGSTNICSPAGVGFNDTADDTNNNNWQCIGKYGGSSVSCSSAKVNGVCNNSIINSCNVGSFSDLADDASYNYWQCLGSNNGTNSGTCSKVKQACNLPWGGSISSGSSVIAFAAQNSACGTYGNSSETRTCNDGTLSGSYTAQNATTLTTRTGQTTSAVSCGTSCVNQTQYCQSNGAWGGSGTTSCSPSTRTMYTPLNSGCGTYSYASEGQSCQSNGAWTGSYTLGSAPAATSRTGYLASSVSCGNSCSSQTQYCQSGGGFGGTGIGSCSVTPVNGSCGGSTNTCPIGSLNDTADDSVNYKWDCTGSCSGTTASCTFPKVPVVSVSMSTGNGGSSGSAYDQESGTLSWTASNSPSGCSIYRNGSLLTTTSGGTTSYGTPALSAGNTTYRVDCTNAGGTGTGNTVTFKVPLALTGVTANCPVPGTTVNFTWSLPSGAVGTYLRFCKSGLCSQTCATPLTSPNGECTAPTGSSYSFTSTPNATYSGGWIHARDSYNNNGPSVSIPDVYCNPANPAAPSISGPTLVSVNGSYSYNFSAADSVPANMQVKYVIDWNNDGTPDITTSLGNSGWTSSVSNGWSGAGAKTFQARTVASDGRTSGWTAYNVTVRDLPVVTISSASGLIDYNTQGAITWTSSYATGGCNVTKAGNAWQSGTSGSSVATGALTSDTVFDIYCSNGVDTTHGATTIYVRPAVSITPTPATVACNTASSIAWSSSYAASCSVTKAGSAWMTGTSHAGASSGNLLSTTAFNLLCTAGNGNTKSQSTTVNVSPLNGACKTILNSCITGTYQDVTDTAAAELWNCVGSCGGTTATNCSILKVPMAPIITGPTDGAINTSYNFSIQGVDNAGYQVQYGIDSDINGIQDEASVLGNSNWIYTWTNDWGGEGIKYFRARTITSDGRYSAWSSTYSFTVHGKPTVSITPAANPVNYNTATTITWSSGDSTSCSVTKNGGAWQSGTAGNAVSTGVLTSDTTFLLTCNGAGGTNTASTVVYVRPSTSISASPTSIAYNTATTISWGSNYAASCNITKDGSAWQTGLSNAGITSGLLNANSTFQIYCSSVSGQVQSTSAIVTVAPLNGACNAAHYVCNAGTSANNVSGAMKWTWNCNGANGGTNATCEETKPNPSVPVITGPTTGKINTSYSFGFTATNASGDPIRYAIDWDNDDTVDGYLPISGTIAQGTTLNWINEWAGSGTKTFNVRTETNGGPVSGWASHSITLFGLPAITWTPGSANVVYGGRQTFGYSVTDASYCNLFSTLTDDWNTYEATPYISGGATEGSWTNAGPYYKNFRRKAVCYNPFGEYSSAEIAVTVLQNAATCGTITAPEYLLPSQTFNPVITMNNTGTNVWTNGSPLKHRIYTSISNWSTQYLPITNSPVGTGQLGNFTGSITAPSTEGLYDFTWRAIETTEENPDEFGPVCSINTSNENKIVVKNPTLGVGDTDVDVDLLAFPTNYVANDPAVEKTLTIRNRGGGNVTGNVTIPAGLFTCVSGCSFNIGPGGTSVATISFQSAATGTFGEYATITSDAGTKTVNLTGKTGDKFTVLTSPLDFGQVATSRSKYLNLTITNNSVVQTSSAFAISPTAPFYCVSGCASATVAPLTTRTVRIRFSPTTIDASPISQSFVLPTLPSMTIDLVGQGVKPILKVEEK